ncbi:MAG: di-heme oxidoredictase family protein, partial [Myxococcota bacterium]|nr:di-heme oxidoredictase family protein [Myxococcota bacterium]
MSDPTKTSLCLLPAVLGLCLVATACQPPKAELDPTEHLPGGDTTNLLLMGSNAYIRPARNLSDENEALFYSGNSWFNQAWIQAPTTGAVTRDGLGPLYNATSCSSCHFKDGRGRALDPDFPNVSGLLFRLSIPGAGDHGEVLPDPVYGNQLQDFGLPHVPGEGRMGVTWEEIPGHYLDGEAYSLRKPTYFIEDLAYGPL